MPEFFDYDPLLGLRRTFDYDEGTGDFFVRTEQDVDPSLRYAAEARATRAFDGKGREMRMYATLPPVVQMELRQKGINIYSKDPAMIRRMFAEIDANYPRCKTTDKVHR